MTRSPSPPRRYLALFLPRLAEDIWRLGDPQFLPGTGRGTSRRLVEGALHARPAQRGAPSTTACGGGPPPRSGEELVVFTERQGNAVRLTATSRAAERAGLAPGLSLADARARVPDIVALERDLDAEAAMLARIVGWMARYTPMAAPAPPDGAILDIAGCAHPFGGEAGLKADLVARLAAAGVTVRAACGDTPEAARARARFGHDDDDASDLLAFPVEATEAPPETILALRRAGLKTVSALAARPRAMLAARFGDLALRLTRLLGEEDRRITPERPLPPVFALRRFAEPIGRVEDALACLGELMAETAETLLERHAGGRRFLARLFRSDGAIPSLAIETGRPVRDPAIVMRLFHERLDALSDPIDPGFGFDMIRLDIAATEPLAPAQDALEGKAQAEPLEELVDRLVARLGAGHVARVAPLDSHLPECAAMRVPATAAIPWPTPSPDPDEPPMRPLRLFDPPQPIEVTYGMPEGPPRRFVWRRRAHEVTRWEGPERIAAEWWRRRIEPDLLMRRDAADRPLPLPAGAGGLTRDYYRVEDKGGHRFWLFRHGLQGSEKDAPAWYLHGLFA